MVTLRKFVLVALDVASTVLTLMTGLRENPLLVYTTGRYDLMRSRLVQRKINYGIVRDDLLDASTLLDLERVGESFRFIAAPTRSPANLGEDRSTCLRVNSMNASVLTLQYDDVFGRGARREQIYLYSISAPHCRVVNLQPAWFATCLYQHGSAAACHQHIFDAFDALHSDRRVHVGIPQDFGTPGRPFLKCIGRPLEAFRFVTDLVVLQSYWAGGSFHFEAQSSDCIAQPLVRSGDWETGLFAVAAVDATADVVFAVEPSSAIAAFISYVYSVVSLALIARGIVVACARSRLVRYIPRAVRRAFWLTRVLPLVGLQALVLPPAQQTNIVIARGEKLLASDLWMNHWLFIVLSIADALLTVRTTYVVLEMGTWMLSKQVNVENFLFVCTALTKLTWLLCCVHTALRYAIKLMLRLFSAWPVITESYVCGFVGWYVDAVALVVSYKVYAVLLCALLGGLLHLNGATTLMRRASEYKQGVYGGEAALASFWGSEIVCDLVVICTVGLVAAHALASLLLLTRYRAVTHNRVLQLLQNRFVFVGWDVLVVLEALGIDPLTPALVRDGVALTNCSFAALLQQLYTSGPSGLVAFAGDDVFLTRDASVQSLADHRSTSSLRQHQHIGIVRYPLEVAYAMELYKPARRRKSARSRTWRGTRSTPVVTLDDDDDADGHRPYNDSHEHTGGPTLSHARVAPSTDSIRDATLAMQHRELQRFGTNDEALDAFSVLAHQRLPYRFADRLLRLHVEWRWGKIVLVDVANAPGQLVRTADNALLEFVVKDALTFLKPRELRDFLGYERQLRIA